jgi:hypothetical protein
MVWKTVRPVDKNVEYRKNVRMRSNRQRSKKAVTEKKEVKKELIRDGWMEQKNNEIREIKV